MTCLNATICGNKQYHYYEWCNYYANDGYHYEANPDITCQREDIRTLYPTCSRCWNGFIDCCTNDVKQCCLRSKTSYPTYTPTSTPTPLCSQNHYFQKDERCHFLEKQDTEISYYTDNGMVCCNSDRSKCCPYNKLLLYGIFGTFCLFIIVLFTCLIYNFIPARSKQAQITPENKLARIVPV